MNDRTGRVAIPLEAAAEGGTAIETAAQLAARANAPLHGIFVEDEDLLSLANLPFARQVTLGAGTEPLPVERVELQLRVASVTRPALIPDGYRWASPPKVRFAADSSLEEAVSSEPGDRNSGAI